MSVRMTITCSRCKATTQAEWREHSYDPVTESLHYRGDWCILGVPKCYDAHLGSVAKEYIVLCGNCCAGLWEFVGSPSARKFDRNEVPQ